MRADVDAGCPLLVGNLPFIHVASGGVLPQNIAGTAAGEITGTYYLITGWMIAWTDACDRFAVLQFPDIGLNLTAGPVRPKDVRGTVAGEISDPCDLPATAWMRAQIDAADLGRS